MTLIRWAYNWMYSVGISEDGLYLKKKAGLFFMTRLTGKFQKIKERKKR